MVQPSICRWTGESGVVYEYEIYSTKGPVPAMAGVYIFAKETAPREWGAVYIGQTKDFSGRFDNRYKAGCISAHGASHVHLHRNDGGEEARKREEGDLIAQCKPPCNG